MKLAIAMGATALAFAATPGFALPSEATVGSGLGFVSACSGTTYGSGISPGQVILGGISNGSQSCGYAVSSTAGRRRDGFGEQRRWRRAPRSANAAFASAGDRRYPPV